MSTALSFASVSRCASGFSVAACLTALLALGCSTEAKVRLDVLLLTDYRPGTDFAEVRSVLVEETSSTRLVSSDESFLMARDVTRLEGLTPAQRRRLRVQLVRPDGSVLQTSRTVSFSHERDRQQLTRVCAACEDFACPLGQTCECGREPICVPDVCEDEECAPMVACSSDAECGTGEPSCVDFVCREGACLRAPDDSRCRADEVCSSVDGCRPRSEYARAVLEDGPTAYWRLNEPAGAETARDATGNGWDLAIEGSVMAERPGALVDDADAAMFVDVFPSRLIDPDGRFPDVANGRNPYSFEAWVWWTGFPGAGNAQQIVAYAAADVAPRLFCQGEMVKVERTYDFGSYENVEVYAGVLAERFVHVVGTYDGGRHRLYLDGVEVGTREAALSLPPADSRFVVGQGFDGYLDEVAVYDYALTPAQVARHHAIGIGNPLTTLRLSARITASPSGEGEEARDERAMNVDLAVDVRDAAGAVVTGATVVVRSDLGSVTLTEGDCGRRYCGRQTGYASVYWVSAAHGVDRLEDVAVNGPSFHSVVAPTRGSTVSPSAPLAVRWTPSGDADRVFVETRDFERDLAEDLGAFEIPGGNLREDDDEFVRVLRERSTTVSGGSTFQIAVRNGVSFFIGR